MCRLHRKKSRSGSGFTLVELLLAVTILLLLLGGVVFNFSTFQHGANLDEGATQLEALFRFAQAQASSSGRLVRVTFADEAGDGMGAAASHGTLRVLWEPDPLTAPGIFIDLPEAASYVQGISDLVRVEQVRSLENECGSREITNVIHEPSSAAASATSGTEAGPVQDDTLRATFPPVTFFPDGSSDSIEIVLASSNDEDPRRLRLRLTGITGTLHRSFLAPENPTTIDPAEPAGTEMQPTVDRVK